MSLAGDSAMSLSTPDEAALSKILERLLAPGQQQQQKKKRLREASRSSLEGYIAELLESSLDALVVLAFFEYALIQCASLVPIPAASLSSRIVVDVVCLVRRLLARVPLPKCRDVLCKLLLLSQGNDPKALSLLAALDTAFLYLPQYLQRYATFEHVATVVVPYVLWKGPLVGCPISDAIVARRALAHETAERSLRTLAAVLVPSASHTGGDPTLRKRRLRCPGIIYRPLHAALTSVPPTQPSPTRRVTLRRYDEIDTEGKRIKKNECERERTAFFDKAVRRNALWLMRRWKEFPE